MRNPGGWPSLSDQIELADALFGGAGRRLLTAWFEEQVARIDDPAFVRLFTDHIDLPGVVPSDYAHRSVRSSQGSLLGGIRFYGRDIQRPFVEIVAHSFEDMDALCDCVRSEWSMFDPRYLRIRARPGRFAGPKVLLDNSIHVGRCRDMRPPDDRVSLTPFDDADEAIAIVARRYEWMAADEPELARNVSPEAPEDLRRWHGAGLLSAIRAGDVTVGLLAIAPGRIGWIEGDEIQEEVVEAAHRGHGYAVLAQAAWARRASDPDRLLVGTIDRLNVASRKTAERAGRPRVLDDVFVSLAD
jgi:RimJ/RimL family protein N-acetyltransferase